MTSFASPWLTPSIALASIIAVACWLFLRVRRLVISRNVHIWLGSYIRQCGRAALGQRRLRTDRPIHVLICIADHFEPEWNQASPELANQRVKAWLRDYPRVLGAFRDSDDRPPQHTFFYPIDQYQPHHVDALAGLCREGYGEIEIHLHHDNDTSENLRQTLTRFTDVLANTHGVLGRFPDGRVAFGFVHGNWALDNSHPEGRWCGVNNELEVLSQSGCYADFTMPSAPDATQTRTINSIYYARGRDGCCKSHNTGIQAHFTSPPTGSLLLIQGPLSLTWPKGRVLPKIENGCIQGSQPPSMARLDQWIRAGVQIATRPDWVFVKLHTHGAVESNRRVLLGAETVNFHESLAAKAAQDPAFRYHYVTAREMYNLAQAALDGWRGSVNEARDFKISPPGGDIPHFASIQSETLCQS